MQCWPGCFILFFTHWVLIGGSNGILSVRLRLAMLAHAKMTGSGGDDVASAKLSRKELHGTITLFLISSLQISLYIPKWAIHIHYTLREKHIVIQYLFRISIFGEAYSDE